MLETCVERIAVRAGPLYGQDDAYQVHSSLIRPTGSQIDDHFACSRKDTDVRIFNNCCLCILSANLTANLR